jgi:hypothetical protein
LLSSSDEDKPELSSQLKLPAAPKRIKSDLQEERFQKSAKYPVSEKEKFDKNVERKAEET